MICILNFFFFWMSWNNLTVGMGNKDRTFESVEISLYFVWERDRASSDCNVFEITLSLRRSPLKSYCALRTSHAKTASKWILNLGYFPSQETRLRRNVGHYEPEYIFTCMYLYTCVNGTLTFINICIIYKCL